MSVLLISRQERDASFCNLLSTGVSAPYPQPCEK